MFGDKEFWNLEGFNFEATKKNVSNYFKVLERLEWEWAKLNAQNGQAVNYDFSAEYQKQPYSPIGQDEFCLSAKEDKEEQLKKYISSYYWAKSILSENEQLYIHEYFINQKREDEIVDLLSFASTDCNEFRKLKRSAIYKFADFFNLLELEIVKTETGEENEKKNISKRNN
jgi:DNA-directed RNA polymerase specialized sigma subunit